MGAAAEATMMVEEEMGMARVKVDTTMAPEGRVGSEGGLRRPYYVSFVLESNSLRGKGKG